MTDVRAGLADDGDVLEHHVAALRHAMGMLSPLSFEEVERWLLPLFSGDKRDDIERAARMVERARRGAGAGEIREHEEWARVWRDRLVEFDLDRHFDLTDTAARVRVLYEEWMAGAGA